MSGRAWVFGDRIDTDMLAPGDRMKLPPAELAQYCLSAIAPDFAANVRPGDIVVAGSGFGIGSSREQAAVSLRLLGVAAVLALSFGGIFRRNAINLGLPALVLPAPADIATGDLVDVDIGGATWLNRSRGTGGVTEALPAHLLMLLACGGLVPWLQARVAATLPGL